jgi:hypothetical protein
MTYPSPCLLRRPLQTCLYRIQAMGPVKKNATLLFLTLATAGGGSAFLILSLLNHYGIISAYNRACQWSLLSTGCGLITAFLLSAQEYRKTKGYIFESNSEKFYLNSPLWRASATVTGGGETKRAEYGYHNWYQFKGSMENSEVRNQVMLGENFEVHWINEHTENENENENEIENEDENETTKHTYTQKIYRKTEDGELKELYSTTPDQEYWFDLWSTRYFYPYHVKVEDGNKFFTIKATGQIVEIAVNQEDEVEERAICDVEPNASLSLIRCHGDALILGFRSGLVEIRKIADGEIEAWFMADKEIQDAWIDEETKRIVTFSKMSPSLLDEIPRSKLAVWQF